MKINSGSYLYPHYPLPMISMKTLFALTLVLSCFCISCNEAQTTSSVSGLSSKRKLTPPAVASKIDTLASSATIIQRQQVPILCYHRIQDAGKPADYTVLTDVFKAQLKTLADSGYHSILPGQLYDYLTKGTPLPDKPFMLTFDDTRLEHFTIAAPEMEKHGFKGVFFAMTIPIGKPNYMTADQIKILSDRGHIIGSHTWDHNNVKKLEEEDWVKQIDQPKERLSKITGKPVEYFAYPFGEWNDTAAVHIKRGQFRAAFQLTTKRSEAEPLYTIRRMIVPGSWASPQQLLKRMKSSF
jgi:peptidoglycan/xylan/chitin deacetylase (PgdA/CDA1 family)